MTDQIREQLSALLDGELPRDEMDLLMRRLEKDPELRRTFGSYALIGETLRAPGGRIAPPSFAARVSASIEESAVVGEGIVEKASIAGPSSTVQLPQHVALWKRPMVRTALAASAAATAVLLFRPDVTPVAQLEVTPANSFAMSASPTPAQSQRLAGYMVAHSQFSTPMVRRNVLSSLLAADPGITRVSYEMGEAP
jgi:sigma-E factor negative regulatory protein RseA